MFAPLRALLWLSLLVPALAPAQNLNLETAVPVPQRWAVVIGAGNYSKLTPLKFASSDASLFHTTLIEHLKFEPSNVRFISDAPEAALKPTSATILATLDEVLSNRLLDKGNLFVFYFSGHGFGTPKGDYLMPTDAAASEIESRGIPVKLITERIVKAGLKNVLFVVDACREGTKNPFGRELQSLARQANVALMLSCAPGQRSYEDPSLKHGFFTYHLVESLRDETQRNGVSGSLWASEVARQTSQKVANVTSRKFGQSSRQEPTVWAEKGRDVLIGNFPATLLKNRSFLDAWLSEAKAKDANAYGQLLTLLSFEFANGGDIKQAVDLLRTLESINQTTSFTRLMLGILLLSSGRTQEAETSFAQVIASGDSYDRDQAILLSRSPTITRKDRHAAAQRSWRVTKGAGEIERLLDWTEEADRPALWAELLAAYPADSRAGLFVQALKAREEGKASEARAFATAARGKTGDEPPLSTLLGLEYELAVAAGDRSAALNTIVAALDQSRDINLWLLRYLNLSANQPVEQKVRAAKAVIDAATVPILITRAVRLVPEEAEVLLPNLRQAADRLPFSPEIPLAIWCIERTQTWKVPLDFPEEITRVADSEASLNVMAWNLLNTLFDAKVDQGKVTKVQGDAFIGALHELTTRTPEGFANDPVDAMQLYLYLNGYSRFTQLSFIQGTHLKSLYFSPEADPRLKAIGLMGFCAGGDWQRATELYGDGKWVSRETAIFVYRYALLLGFMGMTDQAKAVLNQLPSRLDATTTEEVKALRSFLGEAISFDEPAKTNLGKIMRTLAMSKKVIENPQATKEELTETLAQLVEGQKAVRNQARPEMRAKFLELMSLCRARLGLSQNPSEDPVMLDPLSLDGHPLFASLAWAKPTTLADCVGVFNFTATLVWDGAAPVETTIKMEVKPDGGWTAALTPATGTPFSLAGKVLPNGVLQGSATFADGTGLVTGRTMPKTIGPPTLRFVILSPKGRQAGVRGVKFVPQTN